MDEPSYWFKLEVLRWRVGASVAWSQIILPAAILTAIVAANLDFLHPIQWITGSLSLLLRPSHWTYLLVLAFMMGLLFVWEAKYYIVKPHILSNRLAYMWNVLNPIRLLFTFGHALGAGGATWCFVNLIDGPFKGLSVVKEIDRTHVSEVNECHLFVVLHGAAVGAVYALRFFLVPLNVLTFPIIQQSKFFHIKTQFYPMVNQSALQVLRQMRYYYIAYYLILGPFFRGWISRNLQLNDTPVGYVDGLYKLLDLRMFWCSLVAGTAIQFLFMLALRLYNVYQTEPFQFPIEGVYEGDRGRTLPRSLNCRQLPIVQYLAYQDLCEVASHSPARRQEIFSLSQPGGHPHNWMAISVSCFRLLQGITDQMTDFNNSKLVSGQLGDDKKVASIISTTVEEESHHSLNGSSVNFRGSNLSVTNLPEIIPPEKSAPVVPFTTKIYNQLKKRKAFAFFMADLPDAASKRLFVQFQIYIWAVEAISQLACASFDEDKYGVVQKTLPEIISTLLSLQEAVEKHLKLAPNTNRKSPRSSPAASDATQRQALRAAIKTGLYRIVNTFSIHLGSIPLSAEHARRLRLFMEYKE